MKILAVIGSVEPRVGGPTYSATNILVAATRAGLSVSAAIGARLPPSPDVAARLADLEAQRVAVHCFPLHRGGAGVAGRWGISLDLAGWVFRYAGRYDLVQTHGSWTFSTVLAVMAAKLWRRRVILVPHETLTRFDRDKSTNGLKRSLKGLIRRFLLWAVDDIIFSSTLERRDSFAVGEAVRGVVLYHPVFDGQTARQRDPLAANDGAIRVGFLGRLDPKKNIELLLEAIAPIHELSLLIAGDGPASYRTRLEQKVSELGLASRVVWLGFISSAERAGFFDGIDLLAMPSAYECFGMASAEALCQAVPVVVSDQTGIAELVARHHAGLVIVPTAAALTAALLQVRDDARLRHCLSEGAARLAEAELSIGSYGAKLAEIYRRVISVGQNGDV